MMQTLKEVAKKVAGAALLAAALAVAVPILAPLAAHAIGDVAGSSGSGYSQGWSNSGAAWKGNPVQVGGIGQDGKTYALETDAMATAASGSDGSGVVSRLRVAYPGGGWCVSSTSTALPTNVACSAVKSAGSGTTKHVATGCYISIANGTSAPSASTWHVVLRDGATGAGTVVFQTDVSTPATAGSNTALTINFPGSGIEGTAATAMVLESTTGVANTAMSLDLFGYDTKN